MELVERYLAPYWGRLMDMTQVCVDTLSGWFQVVYDFLRKILAPVAKIIFLRYIPGTTILFFTANRISISRPIAIVPVGIMLQLGEFKAAFYLFCIAGIADFVDGLVALVHKQLGYEDDADLGAFMDAFCDKIQWILAAILILAPQGPDYVQYANSTWYMVIRLVIPIIILIWFESQLTWIRLEDYFYKEYTGGERALKAKSAGKLKLSFEMIGLGAIMYAYAFAEGDQFAHWSSWVAMVFLWLAVPFARKSLQQKKAARQPDWADEVEKTKGD